MKSRMRIFLKRDIVRTIFILSIFIFSILPLIFLIGNVSQSDINYIKNDSSFYQAILNSLIYSLISSVISIILALISAYFLNFSSLKHKKVLVSLLTLPMLIPTLSIGLGIRVCSGKNGFLDVLFGLNLDLIGFPGLVIGSVIVSFPPTFLVLYDALKYENKEPYDSAEVLGIKKLSSFFHITLPYLKKPLIIAFFACFTLIFSDYGIPMEVAGKVKTLPMYLYEQAISNFKYGRAAVVCLILLIPAIVSFGIELFSKEEKGEESKKQLVKPSRIFNIIAFIYVILVALFLLFPQVSFVSLTFMKGYPNNIAFSLNNLSNVFSSVHGVGLMQYIGNSIFIALLTGFIGTIFAYLVAYYSTRLPGRYGKILDFLSLSSIAIPGIVLGIGFIFLFKNTNGFFYGTITILVAVNISHFLGSPYIMAKNSLSKINRDYEVVGSTLGVSKFRILLKVLIPSSLGTILEMFSYFFLNSMITISAVSFLCTYATQPLSVLISTYEVTGNYEMQAVISFVIIVLNLLFKVIVDLINYFLVEKLIRRKEREFMELNRYQYFLLVYLEKNGKKKYTQRFLADELTISVGTLNKELNMCKEMGFIQEDNDGNLGITEKGLSVLEPYRVRKAIILAAGFGSRMAPVTLDTPKPLVKVNGKRIIDTLIDALVAKGITNIIIVRGYKKEKFDELLEKYPFVKFVDNDLYNVTNNISSAMKAIEYIDRCYICEADLLLSNADLIEKYQYRSNYLGIKVAETDDWCFYKKGNYIDGYKQGGENCYQMVGISYWNEKDSQKLKECLVKLYNARAGKENFWDNAPLKYYKKDFKLEIRKCHKSDVIEIDNFSELVMLDESYKDYPEHDKY